MFLKSRKFKVLRSFSNLADRNSIGALSENLAVYNECKIQLLPVTLKENLFKQSVLAYDRRNTDLNAIKSHLRSHGIPIDSETRISEDKLKTLMLLEKLSLPKLLGGNLIQHFENMAYTMGKPYLDLAKLASEEWSHASLDCSGIPRSFSKEPGWTMYMENGKKSKVSAPKGNVLFFDVELHMGENHNQFPYLAVCLTESGWFSWTSPYISDPFLMNASYDDPELMGKLSEGRLITFGKDLDRAKLVIGHNIGFDRIRILEEYNPKESKMRFFDTLSMHSCVSGISSQQIVDYVDLMKQREQTQTQTHDSSRPKWIDFASKNSLYECATLQVFQRKKESKKSKTFQRGWLDLLQINDDSAFNDAMSYKEFGKVLSKGTHDEVMEQIDNIYKYCALDVLITYHLYCSLYKKFMTKNPSPVSFYGMLKMSSAYLPSSSTWKQSISTCEEMYKMDHEKSAKVYRNLIDKALCDLDNILSPFQLDLNRAVSQDLYDSVSKKVNTHFKENPWLSQLDWTLRMPKFTKEKRKKDGSFCKNGEPRPIGAVELFWKPAWYLEVAKFNKESKTFSYDIKLTSRLVHLLLCLRYLGKPVYYDAENGWCCIISSSPNVLDQRNDTLNFMTGALNISEADAKSVFSHSKSIMNHVFVNSANGLFMLYKIPHPSGDANQSVGNLLCKSMFPAFKQKLLTSQVQELAEIFVNMTKNGLWIKYRKRIQDQLVICPSKEPGLKDLVEVSDSDLHAIIPAVVPAGTVSRRAVERVWMTASGSKADVIGSEFKSLIKAPKGYKIVGADVDSEELWIASLFGEIISGCIHGSSVIGWMTLQGSKQDGTDMHSKTASILGINRNDAKVFNYSRIYGAGINHANQLLMQIPDNETPRSPEVCMETARKLYQSTKGAKMLFRYDMGGWKKVNEREFWRKTDDTLKSYSGGSGTHSSRSTNVERSRLYCGGSETLLFNFLETFANSGRCHTPILRAEICDSLDANNVQSKYLTTRMNWIVQSSAVDFLHCLIVCMDYLMQSFDIEGRLMITIHDEIRYMIREEDQYRAALALQVSHLWTRSLFSERCGFKDIPLSVAFFSLVDIDYVLRKETSQKCETPSWLEPEIKDGKSCSIEDLLEGDDSSPSVSLFQSPADCKKYDTFLVYDKAGERSISFGIEDFRDAKAKSLFQFMQNNLKEII